MTHPTQHEVQSHLEKHVDDYIEILRQMVAINSFTGNPAGVNQLAVLTAELFAPLGFSAEQIQAKNPTYGKHLVLTKKGTGQQSIGLISHLDTVFPPEDEIENDFHWREEGDRIYGPGTNDIKGGTVMIYMLMDALRKFAPEIFAETTWTILINAAEERLSDDFGDLCLERLGQSTLAALVFEAGVRNENIFQLVTGRKGRATFHVTAQGKGSHAGSSHEQGANAIVQLAHTIQHIAELTDYSQQLTFNVGTVNGGSVVNRVPHFAEAKVEMRTFSSKVYDRAVENMLALQEDAHITNAPGNYTCTIEIELDDQSVPWPDNPGTQKLFQIWAEAAEPLGFTVLEEKRGGLSDGNAICLTIPTIDGLGPYGGNAHCSERSEDGSKDQEFANRSSFVPKTLLNFFAIIKLLESTN
jgi:glutamate carboxypeptidase